MKMIKKKDMKMIKKNSKLTEDGKIFKSYKKNDIFTYKSKGTVVW